MRVLLLGVCSAAVLHGPLPPATAAGLDAAQATAAGDTPFAQPDTFAWPGARSAKDGWRLLIVQRTAAERLAQFPDSPHTVVWLWQAGRFDAALDVLERVIERHPARVAQALADLDSTRVRFDRGRGYRARLGSLLAEIRRRLATLDRETAAEIALALVRHEQEGIDAFDSYDARLDRFVSTYAGTQAARLAEVDRLTVARLGSRQASFAALDEIAARYPGTEVAAKAQYQKGQSLASCCVRAGTNQDPTESFLELLAIVADLESGRYPPCTWVDQAPGLVTGYYMYRLQIPPENAERMLAGFSRFTSSHLERLGHPRSSDSMIHLVTDLMPRAAAFLPDGAAAMERQFAAFEREWPDAAAAKLLRASWFDRQTDGDSEPGALALAPPSDTREAEVRALLAAAAASPNDAYARQGLARLAEREFADPASHGSAFAHYLEYERRFAAASDAWIAGLRAAQVEQARGRPGDAAAGFARVATTYAAYPFVRALALGYAGRASEEAGDFEAAARHFRVSLDAWPGEAGDTLTLDPPIGSGGVRAAYGDPLSMRRAAVERPVMERRVAEMARSLPDAGGADLERGRWLLAEGRPADARIVFEDVARLYPGNPIGADARVLARRARLDAAVAAALAPDSGGGIVAALPDLDALAREPVDTAGRLAGVIGAALVLLQGERDEADRRLGAALGRWAEGQRRRAAPAAGSLEADAMAVRDAVFLPLGNPVFGRMFRWPAALPSFVAAPAVVEVKLAGVSRDVDLSRPPPRLANVIFMTPDEVEYLSRTALAFHDVEPDAGRFHEIALWWSRVHAVPGQAEFRILTAPAISSIEFTNGERTRALVSIAVGHSGATAILEKESGVWTLKEVVDFWVS